MTDLKEWFRDIEGLSAPDLWADIMDRELGVPSEGSGIARRALVAALALSIAAAAIVFAAWAFRVSDPSPQPAATVKNGKIAFVGETETDLSISGTQRGIFVVNPDGSGRAVLVDDPEASEWDPAWSPDGSRIAFGSGGEATESPIGLYVASPQGSGATSVLEDDTGPTSPSWSPDGGTIVFETGLGQEQTGSGARDVYAINVESGELTRLTDDPARDEYPALSPDGTKIAFTRQQGEVVDICLMNADGTGVTQLTSGEGIDLRPAWSPDGRNIAFERDADIFVMTTGGSGVTRLTEGSAEDRDPAWSPDGSKIVFERDGDIYIMNTDGTEVTKLHEDPDVESSPAWQPIPAAMSSSPTNAPTIRERVPAVEVLQSVALKLGGLTSAIEGFGSLWVTVITNEGEQELLRVDPATGDVLHTFQLAGFPAHEWGGGGLAIGGGSLWVAEADGREQQAVLLRIDPTTNAVAEIQLGGRAVSDVAFDGQSGRLWVLVTGPAEGSVQVVEIDAATGSVVSAVPFEAEWFDGIVPAAGTAWVLERDVDKDTVQGGELVQIVPGSAPSVATGGSFADAVTDGTSIWAPFYGDDLAMNLASGIARIDPSTGRVVEEWKTGSIGSDIAAGEDGGIWFLGDRGLNRLNPSTGEVDETVHVGGEPIFIVPSPGGLWIGTYGGSLVRFDVSS